MRYLSPWNIRRRRITFTGGTPAYPAGLPMRIHLLLPIVLLLLLVIPGGASADWFKQEQAIMGTPIVVEFWDADTHHAERCAEQVFNEMRRIDALMSPYKPDSELSRINQQAAKGALQVSEEMFNLLKKSLQMSQLSNGAFDITFSSVGHLYDYRKHIKPSEQEIQQSLAGINYRHVLLDDSNHSVRFTQPGVLIDLGGIAKGYAVDNGIAILVACGIKGGLVSAGGDSRILGDRGNRPWMMGIRHPRKKDAVAVVLPLSNTAISTSGDYERFFIEDGKRYHHIISPTTGKSVTTTWSATVIGPDATTTDALSTTLFVLGAEKGLQLIDSLAGIDAVIIDAQGQIHYSSGLMPPETEPAPAGPGIPQ
jgi:thiamine biosynthesis lipoprotein